MSRAAGMLVLLSLALAGCAGMFGPAEPDMPPGSREWLIHVENHSAQPAALVVAEDVVSEESTFGAVVGSVHPATVPPQTALDVVVRVPPAGSWAVFVNPQPSRGPLITAHDVPPDASGPMPFRIVVSREGHPGIVGHGLGPGWFGN